MKLTVLGNNGPYPATNAACSGYLVESDSGNTKILLECGSGILSRLLSHTDIEALDGIVLSHLHYDHMSDMLPLHYALQFHPRKKALDVYAPSEPANVRTLLSSSQIDLWPMKDVTIGEMRLSFCPARHPIETYAVSIECDGSRFVYTGDSNSDTGLEIFCTGADLLLADAGLSEQDYTESSPHFSAALCGKLARDVHARKLLLTHLNPKYRPEDIRTEAQQHFPTAEIAYPGTVYYI